MARLSDHLAEGDETSASNDQVELDATPANVALEDAITSAPQVRRGASLALRSELAPLDVRASSQRGPNAIVRSKCVSAFCFLKGSFSRPSRHSVVAVIPRYSSRASPD